jgi:hypothetical protein
MTPLQTLRCAWWCGRVNGQCFVSQAGAGACKRKEMPTRAEERRIFGGDLASGVFCWQTQSSGERNEMLTHEPCVRGNGKLVSLLP